MQQAVLITRPQPQGAYTADMLYKAGFNVIQSPVLTLHLTMLTEAELAQLRDAPAIIVTSQAALRALHSHGISRDIMLYVTGNVLADIARDHGFTRCMHAEGDVASLLTLIQRDAPRDVSLLYVRGLRVTYDIAASLRLAGFVATEMVAYEAREAASLSKEAIAALHNGEIGCVLCYSCFSAQSLIVLARLAGCEAALAQCDVLCLSEQIAASLHVIPWRGVHIADSAEPDVLQAVLHSIIHARSA